MEVDSRWVRFTSSGEALEAFLARPSAAPGPLPAVIVVQEIWGVDAHVQDLVHRFATAGYVAIAPDLYSRGGRPPELAPERIEEAKALLDGLPPAAWFDPAARAAAVQARPADEAARLGPTLDRLLPAQRPMARWVGDLRAAVAWVREAPEATGRRIGSVGFCMGGTLSALLAVDEPALSAAAVFYGAAPAPDRARDVRCPILGLYGGDDPRTLGTVAPFAQAMAAAGKPFEQVVYPGAPHAFFNDTRRSYRPEPARDAWWRALRFLAEALTPMAAS
jgi:carboxymethylenebutenolidase